ncbi:unnamed protein product [Oppiella nova]|uniref:Fatty acid desaturase domain-containing protein n=1 Tax=Oppiella nova TaxID=334625 RepID=A0A7R9LWT9_9ACAR|nr:unnamed protein product [Oppiella nova]CAG2167698.1 unnamed protein product [Oppiella nova]
MARSDSPQNVYSYDLDDEQYKNVMNEWNCYEHLVWVNIVYYLALHIMALYGFYLCFTDASWYTVLFAIFLYNASIFGITAGVHRLWAHRTYKANLPFRIILITLETIAYQNSVYEWVRDHRVHHKHTESDADPVNSNRGLFFAHCGWLMCQKHPEVSRLGHKIDLSDLLTDQVVMFQKRHYVKLVIALCVVMPTIVPWRVWSENMWTAFFVCVTFRYVWGLNAAWLVNSAAHRFGYRPYDVNIEPADNLGVSVFTLAIFLYNASIFGITAGVHRLWAHRTYKANLPFRIILITLETIAYQNSVYEWVRDHRVHHKYTETDADPLNSNRGFFFAHCGWLMCQKHPEVSRLGLKIDLSDLLADPLVMFQKRNYGELVIALCIVMPTIVPNWFWGESVWTAFFVCVMFRYVWALNGSWLVNSAAHKFGYKPYDVNIAPANNVGVSVFTLG